MEKVKSQAERFIEIRSVTGMNRTEFAKFLGIPYRTVQDWERGKRHAPEYLISLIQYRICSKYNQE